MPAAVQENPDTVNKPCCGQEAARPVSPMSLAREDEIRTDKKLRQDIDFLIQIAKCLPATRERALSITKLQEAVMWLGMDLKRIGEANPYPHSKDPCNTIIDPTAQGLKL